jgi:hypothetical protein
VSALTDLTPNVIAYLLAQSASNASLGGASTPVIIIDGQPVTQDVLTVNATGLTQWLWIGSEGMAPPGDMADAATAAQAFSFLDQARTRDDTIEVQCAAEAVAGDGVMAEARAGAYAVAAAVELLLRGSPGTTPASPGDATMGGLVFWSGVTALELNQEQSAQGAIALVKFTVNAFVRLTS